MTSNHFEERPLLGKHKAQRQVAVSAYFCSARRINARSTTYDVVRSALDALTQVGEDI